MLTDVCGWMDTRPRLESVHKAGAANVRRRSDAAGVRLSLFRLHTEIEQLGRGLYTGGGELVKRVAVKPISQLLYIKNIML